MNSIYCKECGSILVYEESVFDVCISCLTDLPEFYSEIKCQEESAMHETTEVEEKLNGDYFNDEESGC